MQSDTSTVAASSASTSTGSDSVVVLLVDDQAIVGHKVREMLQPERDIQLHFCQDPTKAVELANEIKPTVILQDLIMPELDGLTLLKRFRANSSTRETPMIVLSSKEEATIKAQAFALGANDYLVKLPDRIELVARIRHHSRGYVAQLQRNEAYRKLAETNEALARVNRNYMETLGFVTHELKSPLAVIQSMIDLVIGGYTGTVPEKAAWSLERIRRNCEELQRMVVDYLNLSRAERGELVASKSAIDFQAAVVAPCVQQAESLFSSRNMNLSVECPSSVNVQGDAELLRIALTNYLSNAAKYGREAGAARLEVRLADGQLSFSVWNEGAGFTPAESKALFGKFARLKNENTRNQRGSGLGLYLCQQIAELHGGHVCSESEPDRWARFTLSMPA